MATKGWKLYYNPKEALPLDDVQSHIFGIHCPCRPHRHDDMITHNAFDRREFIDQKELIALDERVKRGAIRVQ